MQVECIALWGMVFYTEWSAHYVVGQSGFLCIEKIQIVCTVCTAEIIQLVCYSQYFMG